ncbi:MAG: DUF6078 family protein [Phocaeicola sp.]|nr:DUF6078 family protein [Phocaeicola sp.]
MNTSKFRPELMHISITNCMRSECPLAHHCLRYLDYVHSERFVARVFLDPRGETGEVCSYHLPDTVVAMARGFKRAIRSVRHGEINALRIHLSHTLGCCKSIYYEYANGRTALTPKQQELVRKVFSQYDVVDKELFDSYEEGYILSNQST